ncbi:acyltransferase family protein [Roseateles sp. So40a]|uniref:acyltransferase family protein n=1 Tax=Roseateles sp. So40a TaxID=3400226 RepID=UPI003A854D92
MFQNIQALRGIAALLVVLHHFLLVNRGGGSSIANYHHLAELGAVGVDLFFCISGFVMLSSIDRGRHFDPKAFALARFRRILPAYWIATLLFVTVVAASTIAKGGVSALNQPLFDPAFLLSSIFLIPVVHPVTREIQPFLHQGWTLSYELYFYALLILAAAWTKARPLFTAVVTTALLALVLAATRGGGGVLSQFAANDIVLEFGFGMVIYLLRGHRPRLGLIACLMGVALLVLSVFTYDPAWRLLMWGVPSALIVYGLVAMEGSFQVGRALRAMGDSSYSLYLTHGVIVYVYAGLIKRGWFHEPLQRDGGILIWTLATLALGWLFYRLVERPLTRKPASTDERAATGARELEGRA